MAFVLKMCTGKLLPARRPSQYPKNQFGFFKGGVIIIDSLFGLWGNFVYQYMLMILNFTFYCTEEIFPMFPSTTVSAASGIFGILNHHNLH